MTSETETTSCQYEPLNGALDPRGAGGNIASLLWRVAEECPEAPAVLKGSDGTSYAGLLRRAEAWAAELRARGHDQGDRVAIFLDRGADAAAAFFGCAAVGGIAVMVNEGLRPRQVEHVLNDSGARFLATSPDVLGRQPRELDPTGEVQVVTTDEVTAAEERDRSAGPTPAVAEDPVQIIYTSGSTGLPKGVTRSQKNLWSGVGAVTSYLDLRTSDRIASLLPFSFDYGFNQLLCAVARGATLVVETSPLPATQVSTLRRHDVTVLPAVPPLWLRLLSVPDFEEGVIDSLRVMTTTGGRLPPAASRRLREAYPGAELFLMYGLTEAFRSTFLPPDQVEARPRSMGRAIPGAEILVLDEDGRRCDPGEVGQLVHRGPTVALGYWNNPEATAERFRPHPLRPEGTPASERVVYSGDLVRRDEDGYLYFVGRRDRLIKTLGYRVSPDEITDLLHDSGQIVEAVVTTEDDPAKGQAIVAHVTLRSDGSVDELWKFCRREAPRHLQPERIEIHDSLPRTTSGKHDVQALVESAET